MPPFNLFHLSNRDDKTGQLLVRNCHQLSGSFKRQGDDSVGKVHVTPV